MAWWSGLMGSKMALGLDVGPSTVKLVELARSAQGVLTVNRCARAALPPGGVVDGQIEHFDAVAGVVRDLVARSQLRAHRVVMALPTKNVILRKVRLRSNMSDEELAVHVESEAAGFVPFPVEELALDFTVVGPVMGSASEIEVLIAAARKDRVQDRLALAEAAGLEAVVIETESNASQLALTAWQQRGGRTAASETVALVEMGHETMNLKVIAAGEVLFEREQGWGARQLLDRSVREFGISEEQARMGQLTGDLPPAYAAQLVPEHVNATAREIDRMLQFFYAGSPGRRLSSVVLAGGAACLDGLARGVSEAAGVAAVVIDPFEHMRLSSDVDMRQLAGQGCAYLQACGLALRSFES